VREKRGRESDREEREQEIGECKGGGGGGEGGGGGGEEEERRRRLENVENVETNDGKTEIVLDEN
jgi:hypothetical protein